MTLPNDTRTDEQLRAKQRQSQRTLANGLMVLSAAPAGLLIGFAIDHVADTQPAGMISLSALFLALALFRLFKDRQ